MENPKNIPQENSGPRREDDPFWPFRSEIPPVEDWDKEIMGIGEGAANYQPNPETAKKFDRKIHETSKMFLGTKKLELPKKAKMGSRASSVSSEEQSHFSERSRSSVERGTTDEFVKDTFETWDSAKASSIKIKAEVISPLEQPWSDLEGDIDTTKAGEYTLNPETQELDFATAKVFIPDLSSFVGKKVSEVAEYVVNTYGDKYYIPGLEYEQWLYQHENLKSLPEGKEFEELKQHLRDRYCFFFGSTLRDLGGRWCVPCVDWDGSGWFRDAFWLDFDWGSHDRVVLLER